MPASARQAPARGLKPPQHSPKVQRCLQEVDYQKQRSWDLGRDSIYIYIPEDLNLQIAPNRKSMHYSYTFPLTPQIIYLSDFN